MNLTFLCLLLGECKDIVTVDTIVPQEEVGGSLPSPQGDVPHMGQGAGQEVRDRLGGTDATIRAASLPIREAIADMSGEEEGAAHILERVAAAAVAILLLRDDIHRTIRKTNVIDTRKSEEKVTNTNLTITIITAIIITIVTRNQNIRRETASNYASDTLTTPTTIFDIRSIIIII